MELNLTHEDIKFLKELGKELREQDTDGQASPKFWTIGDYEERNTAEGYHDTVLIFNPEDCETYEMDDARKQLKEDLSEEELEELDLDYDDLDYDDELLELYQEHVCKNAHLVYTSREHIVKPNTMFITKQDAKNHLESNHYHYTKDAHTYAMTAWRSPKVERLWKILEKM